MTLRTCKNGHEYDKTSDCPVCPICSARQMAEKYEKEFPKISAPAYRAMDSVNIRHLKDVTRFSEKELLSLHGMGPKAIRILKAALKEKRMSFKTS